MGEDQAAAAAAAAAAAEAEATGLPLPYWAPDSESLVEEEEDSALPGLYSFSPSHIPVLGRKPSSPLREKLIFKFED